METVYQIGPTNPVQKKGKTKHPWRLFLSGNLSPSPFMHKPDWDLWFGNPGFSRNVLLLQWRRIHILFKIFQKHHTLIIGKLSFDTKKCKNILWVKIREEKNKSMRGGHLFLFLAGFYKPPINLIDGASNLTSKLLTLFRWGVLISWIERS